MKRRRLPDAIKPIRRRLVLASVLTVVCSVCAFALVEFFVYGILGSRTLYDPIDAIGMIGPMGVLMGFLAHRGVRGTDRAVSELARGLSRVAEGDYTVELDRAGKGPFRGVYGEFNKMCRRLGDRRPAAGAIGVEDGGRDGNPLGTGKAPPAVVRLRNRMVLISAVLVVASVCVFATVEFVSYAVFDIREYEPVGAVGMILPMAVVLGFLTYFLLRRTDRYVTILVGGISRIATGDFNVALDEEKAGPFREVFETFNRMCRELRGIRTLRDDFVRQFSHEFRTPIMSINGFANLMLDEELPREERVRYLGIIASESQRLADLSSNTLLLAKLESQQWMAGATRFSLDEQLRECVILLQGEMEKKALALESDLAPVEFRGNRDIVRQAWVNLLANAIRYTPEGGRISVSLAESDGTISLSIADSGPGIPPDELPRVFETYFKGGLGRAGKGLGLGLSIVKTILELHGGRIEAKSEVGRGAEFIVRLPASGE